MKTAWSFSVLSVFETCRKKYWHLKVAKDFKDADSDAARDGKFIHNALFQRVINAVKFPIQLRYLEKLASKFADAEGDKSGELQLAMNDKFEPVGWFAKDVWVRAILDLLIIKGTTAILIDWKTGKRKDEFDQLKLAAAILSRAMPEIDTFVLTFVWTKTNEVTPPLTISKEDMRGVWLELMPRAAEIDKAKALTEFPATQSGLCGWCPVTSCPHWFDKDNR